MFTGLDLNETIDYTLPDDKENPTIWKLGVIPSSVFARLITEAEKNEIEASYKLVQLGLKGWDNWNGGFKTEKATVYGREFDLVPMAELDRIPINHISMIAHKILEINQISEKERKN